MCVGIINQILLTFSAQPNEKTPPCSFYQPTYNTAVTTPVSVVTESQPSDISSCSGWGWYLDLDPGES